MGTSLGNVDFFRSNNWRNGTLAEDIRSLIANHALHTVNRKHKEVNWDFFRQSGVLAFVSKFSSLCLS